MMAAATAAGNGRSVLLIEGQPFCGKKLRITGKGRCNVTNECSVKDFLANVPTNPKFLYSSLNKLTPEATMEFFEELGVPLKTERGNRVFPQSDNAHDVAKAMERCMKRNGVRIKKALARELYIENGAVRAVKTSEGDVECESVIVCTGGASYPLTGSTGDGYRFAEQAEHTIVPIRPSLVPLESTDWWCQELQGFSLKNVTLSVFNSKNERIFSSLGEMMFTHFGVTGPLVLSASAHMRDFENDSYRLEIDLKPALDEKKLDARILRDFESSLNRDFSNSLGALAAKSMIPVLVRLSGIPADEKVNSVTREQRQRLVSLFKAFPVSVCSPRPVAEAIVTSGGVDVKEINPRTMESKLVSGLFFAGEVLDVDAYTGGFNLQIAWSTGYTAGSSV